MNNVLIKPLGLVVPADYIQCFSITTESKKVYAIAERNSQTDDIYVTSKAILTCGVSLELPTRILDAATDANTLNQIIQERADEELEALLAEKKVDEKPSRRRRKKVEEEDDDEENAAVAIPNTRAVFLPAAQYIIEIESVPLLQSRALSVFNEKNLRVIEERIGKFNAIRSKIEENRNQLRVPSADNLESSLGGLEESRIDNEGFANYENTLRSRLQNLESLLAGHVEWFQDKFITSVNERSESKMGVLKSKQISFGNEVISRDKIIEAINDEVFDTESFNYE